jgi:hypothetical protein
MPSATKVLWTSKPKPVKSSVPAAPTRCPSNRVNPTPQITRTHTDVPGQFFLSQISPRARTRQVSSATLSQWAGIGPGSIADAKESLRTATNAWRTGSVFGELEVQGELTRRAGRRPNWQAWTRALRATPGGGRAGRAKAPAGRCRRGVGRVIARPPRARCPAWFRRDPRGAEATKTPMDRRHRRRELA